MLRNEPDANATFPHLSASRPSTTSKVSFNPKQSWERSRDIHSAPQDAIKYLKSRPFVYHKFKHISAMVEEETKKRDTFCTQWPEPEKILQNFNDKQLLLKIDQMQAPILAELKDITSRKSSVREESGPIQEDTVKPKPPSSRRRLSEDFVNNKRVPPKGRIKRLHAEIKTDSHTSLTPIQKLRKAAINIANATAMMPHSTTVQLQEDYVGQFNFKADCQKLSRLVNVSEEMKYILAKANRTEQNVVSVV
jgi:hypothetical protein